MSEKIYVNDIGTIISLNCGADVSDATSAKILVKKPDNSEHEWVAEVKNSQYVEYSVLTGDLNLAGEYFLQAFIETPAWNGKGQTAVMDVYHSFT